ncbi:MAG TPA: FAD binding domain-containing protein [Pirellulales bacterium]
MATRDHLVLFINGTKCEVRGSDCFLSLSDFLRYRLALTGTKIVCSEGDCGSCTVLVGRPDGNSLRYLPIDSCIRLMFQLDGVHVVTVEGLDGKYAPGRQPSLTPVQQAMVDCHGSQCGFCTPGFVMAMTGICENHNGHASSEEHWRHGLTGNLCRCTGYTPIINAALQAAWQSTAKLNEIYPPSPIFNQLAPFAHDALEISADQADAQRRAYCPATLDEAISIRAANPQAKIVAGATDVGVQLNKRVIEPSVYIDLNRVRELEGVTISEQYPHLAAGESPVAKVNSRPPTPSLIAGARATWTDVLNLCQERIPQFAEIVSVFGSPQIRNVGTIGGNIINASPIADSFPFLFVMEAELELAGPAGRRRLNINDFYQGYKKFDLRSDELLAAVHIPLPHSGDLLRLYKVSRRRDLDISTFTAAIRLQLSGETIAHAAIAYGAVGPTVLRLRRTEEFLQGAPFIEETMRAAGDIAIAEITPIGDVRGSQDYRYQLARNVLLKFFHEQQPAFA